jgi:hypothetical protein
MHVTHVDHVLMHVRDALATDSRVGELGLDVSHEHDEVVVRGAVSNSARKEALLPVAREVLEQYGCALVVRDETKIPAAGAPDRDPEQL